MKLSKLFFGVAAAAMFAACSSDDIVATEQAPEWNADGTGYVAFTISTAEETASRGVNDNFVNGLASEYAVNNVTLVVCKADGTVYEAYDLSDTNFGGPNVEGSNVTADKLYVQKITTTDTAPYAFVILNHNNLFSINGAKQLVYDGAPVLNVNNLANAVHATDLNASEFTTSGILMMNAPLSDKAGMTGNPKGAKLNVLVNPMKVYKTEAEAKAHEDGVGEVYVERAVAKVELTGTDPDASAGLNWAIQGWTLDNTNKSSYLLHNVSNLTDTELEYKSTVSTYRMVGSKDVKHNMPASLGTATENSRYRTYFGKDPNMSLSASDAVTKLNRVASTYTFTKPEYQYCAENLFDVQHQDYGNTTRALIQVKLTPASTETLYSKPGDDKFYEAADVKTAAEKEASKKIAASTLWSYAEWADPLDPKVTFATTLGAIGTTDEGTATVVATGVQLRTLTTAELATLSMTQTEAETAFAALLTQKLTAKEFGFNYYKGGLAYYDVRIKHFGNEYTPWTSPGDGVTTTALAYESTYNADKYLGRWGVLRNNWYAITISDIKKLGYADPYDLDLKPHTPGTPGDPDGPKPETPDDNTPENEKWIAVDVNVLSWAKRTQSEEL